jgi:hypothetical protein
MQGAFVQLLATEIVGILAKGQIECELVVRAHQRTALEKHEPAVVVCIIAWW